MEAMMDKLGQALHRTTSHADKRRQALRERHRTDVDYVRREHLELADWLTSFAAEFGRSEIEYKVVLRNERR